jgi:hypothetical protein
LGLDSTRFHLFGGRIGARSVYIYFSLSMGRFFLLKGSVSACQFLFLFFSVSNVRSFNLFYCDRFYFKATGLLANARSYRGCLKSIGGFDNRSRFL